MTDKKSNDSRRKLLKSIAAGSGAVVAGKSLPESWTKPIVDSVMLPVHAATTTEDLPDDQCPTLSILGYTVACGEGDVYEQRDYYVDDSGDCPKLVALVVQGTVPGQAEKLYIWKESNPVGGDVPSSINAGFGNDDSNASEEVYHNCSAGYESDSVQINITFKALSGALWTATGMVTLNDTSPVSITVSPIILTPPA